MKVDRLDVSTYTVPTVDRAGVASMAIAAVDTSPLLNERDFRQLAVGFGRYRCG